MSTTLVSRRGLLLGGLATGAALAIGSTTYLPTPAEGLRVLSAAEVVTATAMVEAWFPEGSFPMSGLAVGTVGRVDVLLDEWFPAHLRAGFRYILRVLEWGTLASRGRWFSSLPVEARREVLDVWSHEDSVERQGASDAMRMVFAMAYFSDPSVQAHIGWRSACGGGVT